MAFVVKFGRWRGLYGLLLIAGPKRDMQELAVSKQGTKKIVSCPEEEKGKEIDTYV